MKDSSSMDAAHRWCNLKQVPQHHLQREEQKLYVRLQNKHHSPWKLKHEDLKTVSRETTGQMFFDRDIFISPLKEDGDGLQQRTYTKSFDQINVKTHCDQYHSNQ